MLHTLKHRLARLLYPTDSVRVVYRGPLRGYRYSVGPGMGVSYAWGVETMNWKWFEQHVQPGMTVYDIGANRGQMALMLAHLVGPGGLVVSFEPVAEVYAGLVQNVELNSLRQVRTRNAAVAEIDGELTFVFDPARPTQGQIQNCESKYRITAAPSTVLSVKLETFAATEPPPGLIKIDVEGGGARVLTGAVGVLRQYRPILYIELHGPQERAAVADIVQKGCGYVVQTHEGENILDVANTEHGVLCCFPAHS
jgi:FkbM family methyltransferase